VVHTVATPVAFVLLFVFVLAPNWFFWRSRVDWQRLILDSSMIVIAQLFFALIAATLATFYWRDRPHWMATLTAVIGGITIVLSFLPGIGGYPFTRFIGLVGACGGFLTLAAGLEASQIRAPSTIRRDAFLATPAERKVPPPPPSSPP